MAFRKFIFPMQSKPYCNNTELSLETEARYKNFSNFPGQLYFKNIFWRNLLIAIEERNTTVTQIP